MRVNVALVLYEQTPTKTFRSRIAASSLLQLCKSSRHFADLKKTKQKQARDLT